jgi:tRNA (guanine-N7-)-methyltransferase
MQKAWDQFAPTQVIDDVDLAVQFIVTRRAEAGPKGLRIVVEIGSGQGNQLVHAVQSDVAADGISNTLYIGVEVYKTGVAHTLLLARNAELEGTDYQLLMVDAVELFEALIANRDQNSIVQIDELWTFFPDPWPKKRHHKRRLIDVQFFELVKKVLKPGGIWRVATDWADYAAQIEDVTHTAPGKRFAGRVLTNFEKKGIAAGREIFDFTVSFAEGVHG